MLIGGGSLLNVSLMIGGAKAPSWLRYGGMAICIALGVTSIGLALARYFHKKPDRVKYQPKRRAPVELLPEVAARIGGNATGQKSRAKEPAPPDADAG